MVGMPGQDGGGAVELLGQHDAGKAVRQRDGAERQHELGGIAHGRGQSVRAADQDGQSPVPSSRILPSMAGERLAGQRLAALVERDDGVGVAGELQQRGALLRLSAWRRVAARLSPISCQTTGARPSRLASASKRSR